jgi:ketosteroid isomerase-like protein
MTMIVLVSGFGLSEDKKSEEQKLHDTIMELDSIFFTAYNNCDLETQAKLISEDLEFYHDQGGLNTSKSELMASMKKNICGKVSRELVAGSIEVSEIPGFGAVQIGMHKFYNNQEPNAISKPGRFVTLWKKTDETWQMTRVISLHGS